MPVERLSEVAQWRDVFAALEVRAGVEVEAAGLAALRRTEAHLAEMRRLLDIFEAHVQVCPRTFITSLIAIGTPPSGSVTSAVSAAWRATSKSRFKYPPISPSTASIRSCSAVSTSRG